MREKEAYDNKKIIIYFGAMFFEVRGHIFFTNGSFQAAFVEFRFIMFTKVLMIELARILIHVYKTFKRRVSFKMPLSMYLVSVEN